MKKIIFSLALTGLLFSCSKTEMQQTTDSIKSADSLFRSAKDGFKTLDSISKIVQDSAKFNKVVVPEIEKHKQSVEKVIRENAKSLDSINAVLKKTTETLNKSSDVIKTVDSAGKVLKDTRNPIEALTTISKTLEKVSGKTKVAEKESSPTQLPGAEPSQPVTQQPNPQQKTEVSPPVTPPVVVSNPLSKSGTVELKVENVNTSRDELAVELRRYGGEIMSERFGEQGNERKQVITAKIPYRYYDQAVNTVSQKIGIVKSKNIETTGTDYDPSQMSDLEIILTENMMAGTENISTTNSSDIQKNETEPGLIEKFGITGIIIAVALVLIPLMLLILYFMNRNMKKRMESQFQQNRTVTQQNLQQNYTQENQPQSPSEVPEDDDPYAKYKPKN